MIGGIDVGLKRCVVAVMDEKVLIFDYEDLKEGWLKKIKYVGIDAPLSFPRSGFFRECEKILLEMGIKVIPPRFIEKVARKGIEISEELKSFGIKVFEVYPYATRFILKIAPKAKKTKLSELRKICEELKKYVDVPVFEHNAVDALIAALTVKLYLDGKGKILGGEDGEILIPA